MPAYTTEAIVLRTYDIAENDRLLSVFTRDFGKIRGTAMGCKRVKEGNLAWQDIGAYISIHFYEREGSELARFTRWQLLDHFQKKPKLSNLLHHMYLIELLSEFSSERNPSPDIFRLALAVLRPLGLDAPPILLTRYFEYWLLRLEGLWPGMSRCASCSHALFRQQGAFSPQSLRIYCRNCAPPKSLLLECQDFEWLDTFTKRAPQDLPFGKTCLPTMAKMESIIQTLIQRHLEHDLKSYSIIKELVAA